MRIGLVGWGAIGSVIGKAIVAQKIPGIELVSVAKVRPSQEVQGLALEHGFTLVERPEKVLDYSPDLVVEAADQEIVRNYGPLFLRAQKHFMVLSVGALADSYFLKELLNLAKSQGVKVIVPSGAIGGLDAIKSANIGNVTEVTIRNIKPPEALQGAPYIIRNRIDLKSITCRTQIFEGYADEAAREFPKNLNVAVALGLAGIGPERTGVILIVDPAETRNVHEIIAKGDFGEATFTVCGLPSPDNPKTSYLAGLSALATLRNLVNPFQVGT